MNADPRRLIFLSADGFSVEALRDVDLRLERPAIAICWGRSSVDAALLPGRVTIIDLSSVAPPRAERLLHATGLVALTRALEKSAPGRLVASLSPAHRSRLFAARVQASSEWAAQSGDAIIALDLHATRGAWLARKRTPGTTATLGLIPGLRRAGLS